MTEMIRVAELATEVNLIPPEDAAPPMPEMPQIDIKHQRNSLNFITKELTYININCVPDLFIFIANLQPIFTRTRSRNA